MEMNSKYLEQLEHPEQAITPDVWNNWRTNIINRKTKDTKFETILKMKVNAAAAKLGVYWPTQSKESVEDILVLDLNSIMTQRVQKWRKKSTILTIVKLFEATEEEIDRLCYRPPTKRELEEMAKDELYETVRVKLIKIMHDIRENMTNEDFENRWMEFIKSFIGEMMVVGDYQTKDKERFAKILFMRLFAGKSFEEISKELNVQTGVINNTIQLIIRDFKNRVAVNQHMARFHKKLESLRDTAFERLCVDEIEQSNAAVWAALDDNEGENENLPVAEERLNQWLTYRNNRLAILDRFNEYFLERPENTEKTSFEIALEAMEDDYFDFDNDPDYLALDNAPIDERTEEEIEAAEDAALEAQPEEA